MNVIPAIDMKDGNCVRLLKGDFGHETRYSSDPAAVARQFADMGFLQLHLVDLDGARSGKQLNRALVCRIVADTPLEVQLGGGIRDLETLRAWFDDGIRRAVIGSLAVTDAGRVRDWMGEFGADRIVLALDCRCDADGTPWLATHGWTRDSNTTLWDCIDGYRDADLRHVLCTDVSRDGAMTGPSIDLYREFRQRYPTVELQASGGVRNVSDLSELRKLGAAGAITGRALLDCCITASEVSSFLRDA
jgi:phosphoribosylformimino-5-aminoimidazole carboxamide ribotide isomerase